MLAIGNKYTSNDQIHTASGSSMNIVHIGKNTIHTPCHQLQLNKILHVPQASKNLIYVHRLASDNNVLLEFHPHFFCIKDLDSRSILLKVPCRGGLYTLPASSLKKLAFAVNKVACSAIKTSIGRWHSHLGHHAIPIVQRVIKDFDLPCLAKKELDSVCDACQQAKSYQLPYTKSTIVSNPPPELVFLDIWGAADDFSKFTWIYLIKFKYKVFQKFCKFHVLVKRFFDKKIIVMQTDWEGEYEKLNFCFSQIDITQLVSCPHAHQQNVVVESKHIGT
jgi:hypothetical protein